MLRVLREHATSWMLRGLLILVAVTFISWGGYSLIREKRLTYAAKVNGTMIDMKDYLDSYQAMIKQYRDALGPSFSEKMVEELHLGEKVLDDLISKVLIFQEGERLKLRIGDEELRQSIEAIPYFQVDSQFDPRQYERVLRLNRKSPEDFERSERERLLLSKVVNLIRMNGGMVSEDEVLDNYLFENERINLAFLKVVPDAFKGEVDANEVEVKDYYQKNQEEFRTSPSVQIQYLFFRSADLFGKVNVPPDEVKRQYEQQKERFKIPKRIRVREILIKAGPDDPPSRIEEKRKKAGEVLEKAKKTKDFISLAKQYSESDTASKGGDIGWVQRGRLGEEADGVLFSMKAGDVSDVIRGKAGFSIFKIEEVVDERMRPLEEVQDQILHALKMEKAKAEASRRAEDAFFSLFRSRDLEGFAREKDLPIKTTGFIKEGDEIPDIGRDPTFYSSAFSLKVGEISPVVSIPPNFYILKLLDKKDSRIPPLEEIKEGVKRKVIGVKCEEKARQVAEDGLNQIQTGKAMGAIAKERRLQMEETGFFTRTGGVIPKIGPASEFMNLLSSLAEKNPSPKEVLRTKDGYFVVKLLASESADLSKFPSVKKNLERRLLYQKQEEFFRNWVEQLKAKAKIEINKQALRS